MSENINEISSALAKAQGKIQPASKDKSNPFFKSKYADLSSCWEACREALSENGICVTQPITISPNGMTLTTILAHSSGQWFKSEMPIVTQKNDPQTLGSAITYYRRYCLCAMVGVAPEDDDGEKAQSDYRTTIPKIEKIENTKPVKKVSKEDAESLKKVLEDCDQNYHDRILATIKKQFNAETVYDIPSSEFIRVKNAAVKYRMELYTKTDLEPAQEPESQVTA